MAVPASFVRLWVGHAAVWFRVHSVRKLSQRHCPRALCLQAAPYSKTGGLGDVCGSLPKALAARGHRVMVVVPRYGDYEGARYSGVRDCRHLFFHALVTRYPTAPCMWGCVSSHVLLLSHNLSFLLCQLHVLHKAGVV